MKYQVKRLTGKEFDSTFSSPMKQLEQDEAPLIEFWSYFDSIPDDHFENHDCSEGAVDIVYVDSSGRYEHVLVNSENKNVFMVIVLDKPNKTILGHKLLDLNEKYGKIR
ncbi:hypothetical protein [Desulforhopalus sp. 52FAK]